MAMTISTSTAITSILMGSNAAIDLTNVFQFQDGNVFQFQDGTNFDFN